MKYSIIMASYLREYPGSAKNREVKFRRAVDSVIFQSHNDWELVIVADGCQRTIEIAKEYSDPRIQCHHVPKQKQWSATVRNMGIYHATGDLIVYLDTDDYLGPEHLATLAPPNDMTWGYFDIFGWKGKWVEYVCSVKEKYKCGTGNLIHRRGLYWPDHIDDYDHDWRFIQMLSQICPGVPLKTPQYFNCHVPNRFDV